MTRMMDGKDTLTLTLCHKGFFNNPIALNKANIGKNKIGYQLQNQETKSLTFVHELIHASQGPEIMETFSCTCHYPS